eukprot:SAG31_NODE_1189_length_9480_cov_19.686174_4_plen_49_part_00
MLRWKFVVKTLAQSMTGLSASFEDCVYDDGFKSNISFKSNSVGGFGPL